MEWNKQKGLNSINHQDLRSQDPPLGVKLHLFQPSKGLDEVRGRTDLCATASDGHYLGQDQAVGVGKWWAKCPEFWNIVVEISAWSFWIDNFQGTSGVVLTFMKCWNVSWYNEIHLVLSHRKSPFPSPDLRQPRPRGVGRAAPGFQAFDRTGGGLTGREARRTDVKLCNSLVKGRPVFPEWSERYWNGSVDQNVTANSSSLYSRSLEEFIISTFPLLNDWAKKGLGKAMHLVVTFGSTKKRRDPTTLDEHALKKYGRFISIFTFLNKVSLPLHKLQLLHAAALPRYQPGW